MNIRRPNWSWRAPLGKRVGDPPYIVLHNVGGDMTPEAIHAYHKSIGWLGIAYNEHIADDGDVTIGRPEWAMGGHCMGWNHCYGIVANGNYDSRKTMPKAQYASLVARCVAAKKRWPKAEIRGHREMPGNVTSCPGRNFPLAELKRDVAAAIKPTPKKVAARDYPRFKVLMRDWARAYNTAHPEDAIDFPRGFGWRLPNFGKPAQTLLWRITGRMVKLGVLGKQASRPTPEIAALLGMKKYQG